MENDEGALIKKSIEDFYAEQTEKNLSIVLNVLMGSLIWIPCNAVMEDADQLQMEKIAQRAQKDPDALIGEKFTTQGQIRMKPDILQNGEEYYFPVFSDKEEMCEYGDHVSKVQESFMKATVLARNTETFELSGMVVNAFTKPLVLNWDLLDLITGSADHPEE